MILRHHEVAAAEAFAFNYDLATTPPMAEGGLNMFAQFMDDTSGYMDYLAQTQQVADEVFAAAQYNCIACGAGGIACPLFLLLDPADE